MKLMDSQLDDPHLILIIPFILSNHEAEGVRQDVQDLQDKPVEHVDGNQIRRDSYT